MERHTETQRVCQVSELTWALFGHLIAESVDGIKETRICKHG